jgi:folate-dependent phosphoribosylglycinamide formyltransferase PurN
MSRPRADSPDQSPPGGVGLIAFDRPFGRHIAARLQDRLAGSEHPLVAVLIIDRTPARPAAPVRKRQLPGLGKILRAVSARRRQSYAVWSFEQEALAEFRRVAGPGPDWPPEVAQRHAGISEVNAATTVDWLAALNLRLLVLAGAPVLKAPILEAVPQTLNMHSSLLPRYRGTQAEFWQVHNGDLDQAGLTVHFVDVGVDTGDIVLQRPQHAAPSDGPWLMRARNQLNGLDALPTAVEAVLAGTVERRPQGNVAERAYRYGDITPEATRRVLKAVGRRRGSRPPVS